MPELRSTVGTLAELAEIILGDFCPMTVDDLEVLYDYGYWANAHLFQVLSDLPPADFTKSVAGSYGSIRNTLVHAMSAEWGWLDRCGGPERGPSLNADDFPDLESVVVSLGQGGRLRAGVSPYSEGRGPASRH